MCNPPPAGGFIYPDTVRAGPSLAVDGSANSQEDIMARPKTSPRRQYYLALRRLTRATEELNDLARVLGWVKLLERLEALLEAARRVERTELPK